MTNRAEEHQQLIVEQFTKQAIPFAQMADHSPEMILTASEVGPADTVLDVACGPGVLACAFAQVARHVTGIDLTPAMIEQAQALQQSQGRHGGVEIDPRKPRGSHGEAERTEPVTHKE